MTDFQFVTLVFICLLVLHYVLIKAPRRWARTATLKKTKSKEKATEVFWVDMFNKRESISFKVDRLSCFKIHLIQFKNSGGDEVSFYAQDIPKLIEALEKAKESMWHDETQYPRNEK